MPEKERYLWWKYGVIYHIYPLSYYDTNGDGKGDIQGVIDKLDYLNELGVDAIWLSPLYVSPMIDFGYDVSNYHQIDPVFGTLDDFKKLLDQAHIRNIRIIMDMIMNHTSDKHPWFLESKASNYNNPKRNWYIWQNPKNGVKPNNWKSVLGGSAWEYDKTTKQYYLHTFLKEQPDLNWNNSAMQSTFFKEIEFWLKLGVDGFRFDAINMIAKDNELKNNPVVLGFFNSNKKWATRNQPESYEKVKQLRILIEQYENVVSIGEIYTLPPGDPKISASYLGSGVDSLHLTFDFSLIFRWWNARIYMRCIQKWYNQIPEGGWPSIVLSNHDLSRHINRFGSGFHKLEKAKVAAVMLLTLKGTPFIYYGEEIGMYNSKITKSQIKDPVGKRFWPLYNGRDKARTPMQWNSQKNAGFTSGVPWLPVNRSYINNNVEKQKSEENSLYNLYRKLINIRKEYVSLNAGQWTPLLPQKNGIMAYSRTIESEKVFVFLNFTSKSKKINLGINSKWKVLLSTHLHDEHINSTNEIKLFPYEATILKMEDI